MTAELFLVDSSAWILALRKDAIPPVKQRISQLLRETSTAITGIIRLEILGGAKTPTEFKRLQSRLDALDYIETDASLWDSSCELAFNLRRKEVTVPYTDILIAACAIHSGATLLHADTHFDLIAAHTALKVESLVESTRKFVD